MCTYTLFLFIITNISKRVPLWRGQGEETDHNKMQIKLSNIGKRYNYEWIFRKIEYEFTSENNYVILGANGSGKSTLLQVIAGNLTTSEGEIQYKVQSSKFKVEKEKNIEIENIFSHLSFASPSEVVKFPAILKSSAAEIEAPVIIRW